MVAAHCFFSCFVRGIEEVVYLPRVSHFLVLGISMEGGYDEPGGASGAGGGDGGRGLVVTIGVSLLTWGIGSPPMKS